MLEVRRLWPRGWAGLVLLWASGAGAAPACAREPGAFAQLRALAGVSAPVPPPPSLPGIHVLLADLSAVRDPWSRARLPSRGPTESIGFYSAGCLRGGRALPEGGPAYQIMRPSRNRFYGHPDLLAFIASLARAVGSRGYGGLLVGDLSQPRGGPMPSGHLSHQIGLDADIWYARAPAGRSLSLEERETMPASPFVLPDFGGLDPAHWQPEVVDILRLAALEPRTERILVNPVIKQEVCRRHKGEAWVGKLRPWWGHDEHFHVRLRCPVGDRRCRAQEPVPPGDGCAELGSWLSPENRRQSREQRLHPAPPSPPRLPSACARVLRE